MENWKGINLQSISIDTPKDNERELILYLYCVNCKAVKDFTVTNVLTTLWDRKAKFIEFGSECRKCGKKFGIKISWDNKPSWKYFTRENWNEIIKEV